VEHGQQEDGVFGRDGGHGPVGARIHDLRQSIVVNRITAWHRAGANPQDKLAHLDGVMGPVEINLAVAGEVGRPSN